ncbi:30S ribosomal protein S3 [Candidatus Woesearchaeota archaeon]|nr:30S ribosomal protein S3 [Candidatus Woesearchaeota archaeon]
MIERDFVKQKKKEFEIQNFVINHLNNAGHSKTKMQRTPLGEKIIVYASRPGLVVGREGKNIQKLTSDLKKRFKLENPQIEIAEVENPNLDANIVAERISSSLERFGSSKFKGVGHKVMSDVMGAGALGIEIIISGKVPSSRAKSWRFYQGYLKKCGDIALSGVDAAYAKAKLKSGVVGIQVRIMPPDTKLPDHIELNEEKEEVIEEVEKKDKENKKTEKQTKKESSEEKIKKEKETDTKKETKKKDKTEEDKETESEEEEEKTE